MMIHSVSTCLLNLHPLFSMFRLLLKLDPAPTDFVGDTVDIFDFPWVTETALVESTKLLFGLFR